MEKSSINIHFVCVFHQRSYTGLEQFLQGQKLIGACGKNATEIDLNKIPKIQDIGARVLILCVFIITAWLILILYNSSENKKLILSDLHFRHKHVFLLRCITVAHLTEVIQFFNKTVIWMIQWLT